MESTDTSEWDALSPEEKRLRHERSSLETRGKIVRASLLAAGSHLEPLGFTHEETVYYKGRLDELIAAVNARVEERVKALAPNA